MMMVTRVMSCALLASSVVTMAGCADPQGLEERSCPCVGGYSCRLDDNVCVTTERITPGNAPPRCTRTAPECTQREQILTDRFASADDAKAALVGRWLACEGTQYPAVVVPPDFVGYEFKADGTWTLLRKNTAGDCENDTGFGRQGTWQLTESTADGGDGIFQVTKHAIGGGDMLFIPAFSAIPRKASSLDVWGLAVADPQ